MLAAIEIYNKPRFEYRDECFSILSINAWELVLKAVLSKNRISIYYPKEKDKPYRTLTWRDAFKKAAPRFPKEIQVLPVRKNLELLNTYRDNSVHFYNKQGFGNVIYALAQTSIVNFKDLIYLAFRIDLSKEITWQLLPLGIRVPIDPIEYISKESGPAKKESFAVRNFLSELTSAVDEVESAGMDTGRLLTVFNVKLESVKKIEKADVVTGVKKPDGTVGTTMIVRKIDPNVSYPLKQKNIIEEITEHCGIKFSQHVFQALVWKYDIRKNPVYCWRSDDGALTKYSNEIISWIKRLSEKELLEAVEGYREHLRRSRIERGKSSK